MLYIYFPEKIHNPGEFGKLRCTYNVLGVDGDVDAFTDKITDKIYIHEDVKGQSIGLNDIRHDDEFPSAFNLRREAPRSVQQALLAIYLEQRVFLSNTPVYKGVLVHDRVYTETDDTSTITPPKRSKDNGVSAEIEPSNKRSRIDAFNMRKELNSAIPFPSHNNTPTESGSMRATIEKLRAAYYDKLWDDFQIGRLNQEVKSWDEKEFKDLGKVLKGKTGKDFKPWDICHMSEESQNKGIPPMATEIAAVIMAEDGQPIAENLDYDKSPKPDLSAFFNSATHRTETHRLNKHKSQSITPISKQSERSTLDRSRADETTVPIGDTTVTAAAEPKSMEEQARHHPLEQMPDNSLDVDTDLSSSPVDAFHYSVARDKPLTEDHSAKIQVDKGGTSGVADKTCDAKTAEAASGNTFFVDGVEFPDDHPWAGLMRTTLKNPVPSEERKKWLQTLDPWSPWLDQSLFRKLTVAELGELAMRDA